MGRKKYVLLDILYKESSSLDENAKWAGTFLGMHSSLLVEPRRRRRRHRW